MFNLLSSLPLLQMRKALTSVGGTGPAAAPQERMLPTLSGDVAVGHADSAPAGCGWFDSSHDLQHGLCVLEHAGADTLADALPLDNWLALHLAGWSPAQPH